MIKRNYYSVRTRNLDSERKIDFKMLKKLFLSNYNILDKAGIFKNILVLNVLTASKEDK